jgi:hypothetical protein
MAIDASSVNLIEIGHRAMSPTTAPSFVVGTIRNPSKRLERHKLPGPRRDIGKLAIEIAAITVGKICKSGPGNG